MDSERSHEGAVPTVIRRLRAAPRVARRVVVTARRANKHLRRSFRNGVERRIARVAGTLGAIGAGSSGRGRAIVIQPGPHHAEVVLGLLPLLHHRFAHVDVIAHPRLAPQLRAVVDPAVDHVRYRRGPSLEAAMARALASDHDLVLVTTVIWRRLERHADRFAAHPRAFGIVHDVVSADPDRLARQRPSGPRWSLLPELIRSGRFLALFRPTAGAAPTPLRTITPIHRPPTDAAPRVGTSRPLRLTAVGRYGTDLDLLVRGLAAALASGMPEVPIDLVGRWSEEELGRALDGSGVEHLVVVAGRDGNLVDERALGRIVEDAAFLVKAKPTDTQLGRIASGARGLSLGSATPLVLDERLADEWGLPRDACVTFSDDRLEDGLRRAVAMGTEERAAMTSALERHRAEVERADLALLDTLIAGR
ncbi:MAG: hypothetical protein RLZZ272_1237 [Actinomycetota bacterium]